VPGVGVAVAVGMGAGVAAGGACGDNETFGAALGGTVALQALPTRLTTTRTAKLARLTRV
jgi:hypothetical protein